VGPYSYYLNDIIGTGFTSTVYRGIKDDDKNQIVAMKVIQLADMTSHRRELLDSEVRILKMVYH
jgi:hypothetical protein